MKVLKGLIVGSMMICGVVANASSNCELGNLDPEAKRLSEQYYKLGHNYIDSALSCAKDEKKTSETDDKKCLLELANGYSALLLSSAMGRTSYERTDGEMENLRFTLSKFKMMMGPYVAQLALNHATEICNKTKGGWCENRCIPEIN